MWVLVQKASLAQSVSAQQSVHPTLGILARFQAFFYASAFFQSDGVPPPAPARVTQTVGWLRVNQVLKIRWLTFGALRYKIKP